MFDIAADAIAAQETEAAAPSSGPIGCFICTIPAFISAISHERPKPPAKYKKSFCFFFFRKRSPYLACLRPYVTTPSDEGGPEGLKRECGEDPRLSPQL
jgi:hypothetical protein